MFVMITALLLVFERQLEAKNIHADVAIAANLLLFLIGIANVYLAAKNMQDSNPRAFVRGVMAGTLLKLVVVAAAVLIYLVLAGPNRNRGGVLVGMGLYVIYTFIEVKIALRLNPRK